MISTFIDVNRVNAQRMDLDADLVVVHDPQPAPLVEHINGKAKRIWRCHIDLSHPDRNAWRLLSRYVLKYDGVVFSLPKFAQRIPIPQYLVYPSIDPLSDKNRELTEEEVNAILDRMGIPRDLPILLQVSRFDWFKDPIGVIQAFRMVKKHNPCRLILAGGSADDDPEGEKVLALVREAAANDPNIHILLLPPTSHLEINALQRGATIVLQKSTREGFGLTVAEALWKGKPVIGGCVGGITAQILFGITGYTVSTVEGAAFYLRYLLENPQVGQKIGEDGREFVRQNFLITRHLADHLGLMTKLLM
jgi:trehalose synthase